jgi:WhiB family transcriptional regulator, redox-sensing transcriptional regulator
VSTDRLHSLLMYDPYAWQDRAECKGVGPGQFFAALQGKPVQQSRIEKETIRDYCNNCTVREHCLNFAMRYGMDYGIWGGLTERQRRDLHRQRTPSKYSPPKYISETTVFIPSANALSYGTRDRDKEDDE